MLNNLQRVILLSLITVSLVACNDNAKNSSSDESIDTGVIECDRYIKLVHELQLSSKLPADPEESLETTINHFKQLIEKNPESTKRECNSAYTALRSMNR